MCVRVHACTRGAVVLIVCLSRQRTRAAARGLRPGLVLRPQAGRERQFRGWGRVGETLISTNPGARVCGVQGAAEGCGATLNELMRASSQPALEGSGARVPAAGKTEALGAG